MQKDKHLAELCINDVDDQARPELPATFFHKIAKSLMDDMLEL